MSIKDALDYETALAKQLSDARVISTAEQLRAVPRSRLELLMEESPELEPSRVVRIETPSSDWGGRGRWMLRDATPEFLEVAEEDAAQYEDFTPLEIDVPRPDRK